MPRSLSARLAAWAMLILVGAAFFGLTQKLPRRNAAYDFNPDRLQSHFQQLAVVRPQGSPALQNAADYVALWLDSLQMPVTEEQVPVYQEYTQPAADSTQAPYPVVRIRQQRNVRTQFRGRDTTKTLLVQAPLHSQVHAPNASGAANAAAMLESVAFLKSQGWQPETNVVFFWGEYAPRTLPENIIYTLNLMNVGTKGKPVLLARTVPPAGGAMADAVFATRLDFDQAWLTPLERSVARGTAMDTPEKLSARLLRDQTNALLHFVQEFREQAAASKAEVAGYFSLPLLGQFVYTHTQVQIIGMTWGGLFIVLLLLGLVRGVISIGSYLWSLLIVPVLIGIAALGAGIFWQLTVRMHPSFTWWGESMSGVPGQEYFVLALTLLTLGGFWLLYSFFAGFLRAIELGAAALTWAGLGLLISLVRVPLWSYLPQFGMPSDDWMLTPNTAHFWLFPMVLGLLSWLYVLLRGRRVQHYNPADTLILTIFFLPAGLYLGEIWLPLFALEGLSHAVLLNTVLALWMALFLPQWRVLAGGLRWTMPLLTLLCGFGLLIYANVGIAFSKHHKRPNSAFFAINLSSEQAFWGSTDPMPDTYTRQFFANLPKVNTMPAVFPKPEGLLLTAPDSMRYLPAPELSLLADSIGSIDSLRYTTLQLVPSKREAEERWLYLPDTLRWRHLHFPQLDLHVKPQNAEKIELIGLDTLQLQLITPARSRLALSVIEVKQGVAEVWNYTRMTRRLYMMPRPDKLGEAVLVRKDFDIEKMKSEREE